jgi:hypothetical protein
LSEFPWSQRPQHMYRNTAHLLMHEPHHGVARPHMATFGYLSPRSPIWISRTCRTHSAGPAWRCPCTLPGTGSQGGWALVNPLMVVPSLLTQEISKEKSLSFPTSYDHDLNLECSGHACTALLQHLAHFVALTWWILHPITRRRRKFSGLLF